MKKIALTIAFLLVIGTSIPVKAACSHGQTTTSYDHRITTFTETHIHDKVITLPNGNKVTQSYTCTITKERAVYKTVCSNCGTTSYDVRVNTLSHSVN